MTRLMLASRSVSRQAMLTAAGVPFEAVPADVDEAAAKAAMREVAPRDLALHLAELKASAVSAGFPDDLVLGSDSLVALADGTILDKPVSRDDAAEHLRRMSGATHLIWSAAVLARAGEPIWRHVEAAELAVRPLSEPFITRYLDAEWPEIAGCVGCFRIEGPGVQLFERVAGSHFTILGMPLLPLLGALREQGVVSA